MAKQTKKPKAGDDANAVSRVYRDGRLETPSSQLDDAILSAARAATEQPTRRKLLPTRPLALAAVVVLSVTVVMILSREAQDPLMPETAVVLNSPPASEPEAVKSKSKESVVASASAPDSSAGRFKKEAAPSRERANDYKPSPQPAMQLAERGLRMEETRKPSEVDAVGSASVAQAEKKVAAKAMPGLADAALLASAPPDCDVRLLAQAPAPDGTRSANQRLRICNGGQLVIRTLDITSQKITSDSRGAYAVLHQENVAKQAAREDAGAYPMRWLDNQTIELTYPKGFIPPNSLKLNGVTVVVKHSE